MNLAESFAAAAARWRDRTAIVEGGGRAASYGELAKISGRMAAAWSRAGVGPGDRVLVAVGIGVDLYAAIGALWRLGAVVVFPEPALGMKGLRHAARTARPKAFLAGPLLRTASVLLPEFRSIPLRLSSDRIAQDDADAPGIFPAASDHPALLTFTSGSTGLPKGIVRTHGFLAAQNAQVARLIGTNGRSSDDLVSFPVFVVANLALGVTSWLPFWDVRRPDRVRGRDLAAFVNANAIDRALLPPSLCAALAGERLDLSTVFTGGGPVFPDMLEGLAVGNPDLRVVLVYGSTEAEPIAHLEASEISSADFEDQRRGRGLLAGFPVEGIRVRIVDDELQVAGDHVVRGYVDGVGDAETKVSEDGTVWHRTGDAASVDGRGRIWLLGRRSGRAGNMHPFEAELPFRGLAGVGRGALVPGSSPPLVLLETDRDDPTLAAAAEAAGVTVGRVRHLPVDARHGSKIDYGRLAGVLRVDAAGRSG